MAYLSAPVETLKLRLAPDTLHRERMWRCACLSSEASPEDRGQTLAQDTDGGTEVEIIVIIIGNIIDTYTCRAIYIHHYAQPSKQASGVDATTERPHKS